VDVKEFGERFNLYVAGRIEVVSKCSSARKCGGLRFFIGLRLALEHDLEF
jgi:hypothetical protein